MKTWRTHPILTYLALALALAFLGSACTSPLPLDTAGSGSLPGKSTLTLLLEEGGGRTLFPHTAGLIKSYRITLSREGAEPVVRTVDLPLPVEGMLLTALDYGTWTLVAEGKNALGGMGDTVANNGTGQPLTLDAPSVIAPVSLNYLLTGTGNTDVTFQWPTASGISQVKARWNEEDFTDLVLQSAGGTSSALFRLTDTAAGRHTLRVRFLNAQGNPLGGDVETVVWIFHKATTSHVWPLTAADFLSTPTAPTGADAKGASGGARVTWTDASLFEQGFRVERRPAGSGDWTLVKSDVPANATAWTDTTLSAASTTRMEYRVAAYNNAGTSSPSTAPSVNTTGYVHPVTGDFSPTDVNGATEGWGWSAATWKRGAHFSGNDLEVAVYSSRATRILLEVYAKEHYWATNRLSGRPDNGGHALYEYWMEKGTDQIWRAKITDVRQFASSGLMYAFRVWGPNWPWDDGWLRGNSTAGYTKDWQSTGAYPPVVDRFNPNKVLTDPYAYELTHDTEYPALASGGENGGIYGTGGADTKAWDGTTAASQTYTGTVSTGGLPLDRRAVDTGRFVSKTYALDTAAYTGARPNLAEKDLMVYEAHVKGLTKHPSSGSLTTILQNVKNVAGFGDFANVVDIPAQYRGTYKGAGMMAPYFKALGINAIEFVPIHETRNDMNDSYNGTGSNPGNYWGYMTYSFFAPDRHYSYDKTPGGPTREYQEMVAAFAAQGIEVWLDVVYNHTGEGGNWGNPDTTGWTSYGGFGATDWYHINPGNHSQMESGATGTGNQLNFSEGRTNTHTLVLDSLSYWIDHMGTSGFRFDLAAVLARDSDNISWDPANPSAYWNAVKGVKASNQDPDGDGQFRWIINHSLPISIAALGSSKNAKMVAETWDNWTYPVGMYPAGWMEWNGRYRDATRKFMKGDSSGHDGVGVNDAFYGDYSNYHDNGGPQKSVNFLVAHDGFTLADLVSYNLKQNSICEWPFGPSDGGNDNNDSWDSGSDTSFRRQRLRNLWVWQFFSRGVPMIVWGDEFGRTQNGNNNPYNIDSVATWNNYEFIGRDSPQTAPPQGIFSPLSTSGWKKTTYEDKLGTDTKADGMNNLFLFAQQVMNIRKNEPALRQDNYGMNITYKKIDSVTDTTSDDRARTIRLYGSSVTGGTDYLLLVNMWQEDLSHTIPTPPVGKAWKRIVDTAAWAEGDAGTSVGNYWPDASAATITGSYGVKAWSIVVLKAL